jgi:UDP-N-acetylmuramoylalanine--D-glutamate ligase
VDAGNIGTPLADLALRERPPRWAALELSSFQLHDTPSVNPTVGVVTNLSPDHLDRYASLDDYYADKARIFANAHAGSRWVLNADDAAVLALHARAGLDRLAGTTHLFSVRDPNAEFAFDRRTNALLYRQDPFLGREELPLLGDHNVANALAAALAVMGADELHRTPESRRRIAEALRRFRALEHRIESVGLVSGIEWINDSKSTNVASTLVALAGMRQPTVLLLGGRHKGEPYTALANELRRTVKCVIAYGEAAPLVVEDLRDVVPVVHVTGDFETVIRRAREAAAAGDAVLLSPACSSYDMFDNYEQRGRTFKALAAAEG